MGNETDMGDDEVTEEISEFENRISKSKTKEVKEGNYSSYGWRVGDDGAQYGASCYRERRFLQVRGSRRQGIRGRQRDTLQ